MKHRLARTLLAVLAGAGGSIATAQEVPQTQPQTQPQQPQQPQQAPAAQQPAGQDPYEGKPVRAIRFEGATTPELITRYLKTQVGNPLRMADLYSDEQTMWSEIKVLARQTFAEETDDGGVVITFVIEEQRSYDRVVFKGLSHFSESQARAALGLTASRRVTDILAADYARDLEERYWRDGYYFAKVSLERDDEASTLTMVVDEGPKVTVREVHFSGSAAFPGDAPMNLYRNLIGSADVESKPAGKILRGNPYSEEAVDADLDRLRVFYRSLGYRDARVELAQADFTDDLTQVDLTFRVIEGKRYKIRSIDLQHYNSDLTLDPDPLYPKEQILGEFVSKVGDYYDRENVNRDKRAIERFYGARGHPISGRFGRAEIPEALRWVNANWQQPVERFDPDTGEIDLIYQIIEGTPKKLRDVVVRGNTDTQDRIVRRKIQVFPGETLDIPEVEKSLEILDSLRYFQDPETLQGVRFELLPVDNKTDEVDLAVQVEEGDTGSFLWGAGISTGLGVQGRVQFNKRNFDLFRLPSSPDPVTVISEVIDSKAFHGGGQELEMFLAPGTKISTFQISLEEPDLFNQHIDTIGGRVQAYRRLRILDSYETDSRALVLGLQRNFSENLQIGLSLRQETTEVEDVEPNAPTIVFDSEGSTEIRSLTARARLRDLDSPLTPSQGYDLSASAEIAGGLLGAEEDFYKFSILAQYHHRLYRDSLERPHVLYLSQEFDYGHAYGDSDDLFLSERYLLGGSNLRGFDQYRAGPMQFGRALGGEAMYVSRVEYRFPLVSTRFANSVREVELLRGVIFNDAGLLGTSIDDPTFGELRMTIGFGIRIHVPVIGVPIALDLGLPLLYEETDDRRPFYFSLSR
jgi:outer membrane protein insertion porin family